MLEAPIYRRPDHVLQEWQIRDTGGVTMVAGLDARTHEPLRSNHIEFFDSEQELLLDDAGTVWLIPFMNQLSGYTDRTDEFAQLMMQHRSQRALRLLTDEQLELLHKLTSKKHV
jgi:hypothetical protein